MDVYCPGCGEPWDLDSLHEEAGERYGIPFYLPAPAGVWNPARERNPAYDSDAYQKVFAQVRADFRARGCNALEVFGTRCSPNGSTRAQVSAALMDVMGDDLDGVASELEDAGL